jgi:hypothetical protein
MSRARSIGRRCALVLALLVACGVPASAAPWLFITDIHLDPASHHRGPVGPGSDTNVALLDSALAAMRRVDPDPPVVVVGGDLLAHSFNWPHAAATIAEIAHRLGSTFPNAQFVVTLGNEDSACGDYEVAPHSAFLARVAHTWGPLVNRHGAAPGFSTTFPRDGFYVTRLPLPHVQAIVIDDVFWSPRYHACISDGNPAAATLAELTRALHSGRDRHWILLHIPPGIDAFSTAHLAQGLVVVPFLDPRPRAALDELIADPSANVTLVIAAHTHKFGFRIAGTTSRPVPMLAMPSISPIFGNAPGFLTANVDPDGTLRTVRSYAFDGTAWHARGGFPSLGVDRFTGAALLDLQRRLARDTQLRDRFAFLYEGGGVAEIDARNWPIYWCATTAFTATAFRACTNQGGTSVVTSRGLVAIGLGIVIIAGLAVLVVYAVRRRTPN